MMDKSFRVFCTMVTLAIISSYAMKVSSSGSPAPAPGPGASCDDVIYNMMDCVTFIGTGSASDRPTGTCCSGVKSVLDFNGACICVAIKSISQLGIELNMTRVQQLPSLCNLKPYPLEKCGISGVSGPSPAEPPATPSPKSPTPAPPQPVTPAPLPPKPKAPTTAPPAESPKESGCHPLGSSSLAALFSISLAICYFMFA